MKPSRPDSGAARNDGAWVIVLTLATLLASIALELNEKLAAFARRFEAWQLDEFPLTLTALAVGLAWFAWRRRREAALLLEHNRELSRQLIDLQESERRALARELHDEIAQHCTAIRIEAAYAARATDADQRNASAARAATAAGMLHDGVRRLLRRLRPAELDELGLVAALQSLCDAWSTSSGLVCRFEHAGPVSELGTEVDMAIYRIAQEALSNVMQHARASRVEVRLEAGPAGLVLQVDDDGQGADWGDKGRDRRGAGTRPRGLGLLGASERAASLAGELQVTGGPGRGTRIRLSVPHRGAVAPANAG